MDDNLLAFARAALSVDTDEALKQLGEKLREYLLSLNDSSIDVSGKVDAFLDYYRPSDRGRSR